MYEYYILSGGLSFVISCLLLILGVGFSLDKKVKKARICMTLYAITFVYAFISMCVDYLQ